MRVCVWTQIPAAAVTGGVTSHCKTSDKASAIKLELWNTTTELSYMPPGRFVNRVPLEVFSLLVVHVG